MDRSAFRTLALALLAVVALSVVAATIDSTVVSDGGPAGFGSGSSGGSVAGESESTGFQPSSGSSGEFDIPAPCFPWLLSPWILGLLAAIFFLLAGYAYRESGSLLPPVAVFLALGPPVILLLGLLTACRADLSFGSRVSGSARNVSFLPSGGGGQLGGGGAVQSVSPPTLVFGLLLGVALVAALVMLVTGTGDSPEDDDTEPAAVESDPDIAAVGRAAGAAAERIEAGGTDVENEVFRAWGEMTALLDVPNRKSATPAEFAEAAVDSGMARDDVTALTTLFEAVRYGGFEATEARERHAVTALRNIESTYAESESPDSERGPYSGDDGGENR
ncbi:hypothetical protein C440_16434 [Haloferax mucosum ATCC BAA-1512]|uniref:Protein-glutamine gamma-glutamyltransferase-like C-terminal domain-containing protein n=1 Tax=Haloferax mucosum ATCC BAA-1512 TaxID=662479 RepID=M0I7E8_9EURY|nr:DUF4129 domain-containing protein [Haloferax mucosum]ELZ91917.1 hypothetical protein C440_16434 [Haloferax mucosum ATCC BAA-1512]